MKNRIPVSQNLNTQLPVKVKVIGVVAFDNPKLYIEMNYTLYCLLIEYPDGSRELKEVKYSDMYKYLKYIEM